MKNKCIGLLAVLALPLVTLSALADDSMAGMQMDSPQQGLSPASQAYMSSMKDMHEKMAEGVKDSSPDIAFAQGMIPHHQGAIAMAETELKYGKDPHMRQLAENIIKAQKTEIRTMQEWLKAHPHNSD